MYIRRKVFSTYIDEETGEEKMFSVNEIVSEEAYLEQHQFSEEGKKRISLEKVDSHRGLGRSLVLGGLPGAYAAHAGKKSADKADREGKSDDEIIEEAAKAGKKRGMKVGAVMGGLSAAGGVAGAAVGAAAAKNAKDKAAKRELKAAAAGSLGRGVIGGAASAGLITAAGHYGAKKNAERRVEKRARLERE